MPGKYLEYIKAGRFVVPVEITFLQALLTDDLTAKDEFSSKWAERNDWKEIKSLLKPAVEGCLKFNDALPEKVPKSTRIVFGQDIGLGYALDMNSDKSPFFAVLDTKKNCWTDDEDEEVDENTGFHNFGGTFKSYTPTKLYVKVVVVKKTFSTSDDGKRIQKYMGGKSEDIRQYYQSQRSLTAGVDSPIEFSVTSKDKNGGTSPFGKSHRKKESRSSIESRRFSTGNEKQSSTSPNILGSSRWPISRIPSISGDPFWKNTRSNADEAYYEEEKEDDDEPEDEDIVHNYSSEDMLVPFFRNTIDDEDDDSCSLLDIPDTPIGYKDPEHIEKKYSTKEPTKSNRSPTSEYNSTALDFTNILSRPSTNFNKRSDAGLPSSTQNNQKKTTITSFAEAFSSIDSELRKKKTQKTKERASSPEKLSPLHKQDYFNSPIRTKSSSPNKPHSSVSPTKAKASTLSKPNSPTKAASKISRIRRPKEKPLKLPVYFKKQQKEKRLVTPRKRTVKATSTKRKSKLTSTSVKEKSPRYDEDLSEPPEASNLMEIDPEMPVLEKMVYYTEPTQPAPAYTSPVRLPKVEPFVPRHEPNIPLSNDVEVQVWSPEIILETEKKQRRGKRKGNVVIEPQPIQTVSAKTQTEIEVLQPERILQSSPIRELHLSPPTPPAELEVTFIPPVTAAPSYDFSTVASIFNTSDQNITQNCTIDVDSDDDEEANLFSFAHLSKCCSKSIVPKVEVTTHSINSDETLPLVPLVPEPIVDPVNNMMLPPVKRAPRTPAKKSFPPEPEPIPTCSAFVPWNHGDPSEPLPLAKPTTSSAATQPSAMSTYQLLSNKHLMKSTFLTGIELLNQIASSKNISAEQIRLQLGFQEERRERAVSPDICLGPSAGKKLDVIESRLRPRKPTAAKGRGRKISDNLEDNYTSDHERQNGDAMFRELISRNDNNEFRYEPRPQGDEYDMSQNSVCFVNLIPQYEQQSRAYKMHSKVISELTIEALTEHFNTIRPQICDIFNEKLPSERHQLFLRGRPMRRQLTDLNVCIPFKHDHGMALFDLLADLLVPNAEDRPKWVEYINFVMLPETFIHIYSLVNNISYKRADTEMRVGPCYDDDPMHQ